MSEPLVVRKIGTRMPMSRQMLLDMGFMRPTPEEQAERDAQAAEYERRKAAATSALPGFLSALAKVTEPTARVLLDLHKPDDYGACEGDDYGGYEGEPPGWPCRTVEAVAGVLGITVPPDLEMVGWVS